MMLLHLWQSNTQIARQDPVAPLAIEHTSGMRIFPGTAVCWLLDGIWDVQFVLHHRGARNAAPQQLPRF